MDTETSDDDDDTNMNNDDKNKQQINDDQHDDEKQKSLYLNNKDEGNEIIETETVTNVFASNTSDTNNNSSSKKKGAQLRMLKASMRPQCLTRLSKESKMMIMMAIPNGCAIILENELRILGMIHSTKEILISLPYIRKQAE